MTEAGPLTISDLAACTGLRPDTVRYYERVGLMPTPARTSGDHRRYGAPAVDRLRFIRGAQRLGLRLDDIRSLLAVRDTGECPCGPAEPLLRTRIAEIDAEIDRLRLLRADLVAMADQLPSATCPGPVPGTWCPPGHHATEGRCDACST
ncbi:MerR family DNA-binding protein [Actinomycetospora sp. TBRC 11914]|uniref:MerR family DNA-binding protein n=1 Tax=Actinomycetospora sp. TBRC 11914 TaxID=2729387 RepID=UPI00145D8B78|nr:MerR family DNA-binding protein [Actinomycetospora sp. TBRC 11914]NMO91820.1 MerR family DNA-binding protein [Actinomycetospora sp. TBRC 11914]